MNREKIKQQPAQEPRTDKKEKPSLRLTLEIMGLVMLLMVFTYQLINLIMPVTIMQFAIFDAILSGNFWLIKYVTKIRKVKSTDFQKNN